MIVAKIGGKIVDSPDLVGVVGRILEGRSQRIVLIAGGGRTADLVRDWDRELTLPGGDAHWLAIRAMSLQAELLACRLSCPLSHGFEEVRNLPLCVFDLWDELKRDLECLPETWDFTSDSLAAWAANRLAAQTLLLVKSVGDSTTTVDQASERGWVDPLFAETAAGLRVEWVNAQNISSANPSDDGGLR